MKHTQTLTKLQLDIKTDIMNLVADQSLSLTSKNALMLPLIKKSKLLEDTIKKFKSIDDTTHDGSCSVS